MDYGLDFKLDFVLNSIMYEPCVSELSRPFQHPVFDCFQCLPKVRFIVYGSIKP